MAFQVRCEKKGCGKTIEPVVDKATGKVYCPCDATYEIKQLNKFAVQQLIHMGQIKREDRSVQAFSVKCQACEQTNTPEVKETDLFCAKCGEEIKNVSAQFKKLLVEKLNH